MAPAEQPSGLPSMGVMSRDEPITPLLEQVRSGSDSAVARLLPLVYDELHDLAARALMREAPGHTLQATALVHEAYVRLVGDREPVLKDRAHFFALAARAIRRILVDHARARRAAKRGGSHRKRITLAGLPEDASTPAIDLLALEEAMGELATHDERQARLVELRFFGGLSMAEIAEVLDTPQRTIEAEWAMARAWLKLRLRPGGP